MARVASQRICFTKNYIVAIFCDILCFAFQHSLLLLQLERGLFWYGHHPKLHEMVSDRSSRAENLTDLRKISMRVFFDSEKCEMRIWSKETQQFRFSWNKSLRSYTGHTRVGKNKKIDIIYLNWINLINHNEI